jgi:hypothetical protein
MLCTAAAALVSAAGTARTQEETASERLARLEQTLARELARSAANEAALRALQDKIDGVTRTTGGAERGGAADGGMDDDRVRKIVREVLGNKKTTDQLKKDLGVAGLQAGYKKPVDYQGGGFFIRGGEEFQLNIGARLQLRYIYTAFNPRDRRDGIVIPPSKGTVFGGGGLPQKQGVNPNLLNFDDRSDFNVPRFRLNFQGHLYTKNLTYRLEIDSSTRAGDAVVLYRAWVNWNAFGGQKDVPAEYRDAVQVRFGQEHMPWGRIRSPGDFYNAGAFGFQTLDAPPVTAFFVPNRNVGIDLHGKLGGPGGVAGRLGLAADVPADRPGVMGWLEYHLAVSNGRQTAGRRYGYENDAGVGIPAVAREIDNRPSVTTRLVWDILKGRYAGQDGKDYYLYGGNVGDFENHQTPALNAGASFGWFRTRGNDRPLNNLALGAFYRPPLPVSFDDDFSDTYSASLDAGLKWRGLSLTGELYYQKIKALGGPFVAGQVPTQDQDIWGWYVQAGGFVLPRELELYYQFSGIQAGRTPNWTGILDPAAVPALNNTNPPFNHNHVFGLNWYPFHSPLVKLTAEGAILVNNPVSDSRAGFVSASRETQFQFRTQLQAAF